MTKKTIIQPIFETSIKRAVFINQDICVYPSGTPYYDNITEVVKFLFGEGATIVNDVDDRSIRIKGASFVLKGVKTVNADWTFKEVKEG